MAVASSTALQLTRQAAGNSGVYKKLFTQGANGVDAAQITMLLGQSLKAAGITLPEGAQITLDAAQMILAGGAFANDLATGVKTLQCVGDLSIGLAGAAALLSTLGLIDPTASDFLGLGANVALALASGGANVLADVGCVISLISCVADVGPDLFGTTQAAQQQANRALQAQIQATIAPQVKNAASLVAQYAVGKLNLFDMISQVALNDPTQFATLFPGLATFFPSWMQIGLKATGNSSGMFASQSATTGTATFLSLMTTKAQIQDVIVEQYITAPMLPFQSFETVAPVISIQAASVLSLILQSGGSGDTVMDFNFNVIGAMRGLGITPAILGDDWLFKGLQRNETDITDWESHLPYQPLTLPFVQPVTASGTVVNGAEVLSAAQTAQNAQASELVTLQTLMQAYDEAGDIESLLQIPEAVAMLERWASFYIQPIFYSQTEYAADLATYNQDVANYNTQMAALTDVNDTATRTQLTNEMNSVHIPYGGLVGEIVNMKLTGTSITTQPWFTPTMSTDPTTAQGQQFWSYVVRNYTIDLSDYWKCLNVLSTMQASQLFQDDTAIQDFTGSLSQIETLFQSAYSFMVAKQLNLRARSQVAGQLGIPSDRLTSRYDSQGNLIFYQKKAS